MEEYFLLDGRAEERGVSHGAPLRLRVPRTLPMMACAHSTLTVPVTVSPARYEVASMVTTTLQAADTATASLLVLAEWSPTSASAKAALAAAIVAVVVSLDGWWSSCEPPPPSGHGGSEWCVIWE